jgi:tetratricopeptide (TPR) repeat protein
MKEGPGTRIERAIQAANWPKARKLIQNELRQDRNDHWLLTRLGLTYYEEHQYHAALWLAQKALQIAPYCPLVIWDDAGSLEMLGRGGEALKLYRRLLRWGEERIAFCECGEGLPWARSLIADSYYRIGCILEKKGRRKRALTAYEEYLSRRQRGHRSIYSLRDVKAQYRNLFLKQADRKSR